MRAEIELLYKHGFIPSTDRVFDERTKLIKRSLLELSLYMVEALAFQSSVPFILNLVASRVPLQLRNHLIGLGQKFYQNQRSYCDRFFHGKTETYRNTTLQSKAGCEITLESIINDIESVAKAFTSYKSDLLKLIQNRTIKGEDINRHFQIIHKMDKFESSVIFSLVNTPEYMETQPQSVELKSKNFSDMIESWEEDILLPDDIAPNIVDTIPQREDFLSESTPFLYSSETKEMVVSLSDFPTPHDIPLTSTDCLVLGDLHGNPIKLIYFLLYENIMKGISKDEYEELFDIYYKLQEELVCLITDDFFSPNNAKHPRKKLQRFNEIIEKLIPVDELAVPGIVLLGDVLADRGNNDYYTLKVLERLKTCKISPKILLSNHDREFLSIYESEGLFNFKSMSMRPEPYTHKLDSPMQEYSLMGLGKYLRLGLVTEEEILSLVEDVYIPLLTGLELRVDYDRKVLICFTHAPVPITIIPKLAEQLKVCHDAAKLFESTKELVATADAINTELKGLLRKKELFKVSESNTPLYYLMWKRAPSSRWAVNNLPSDWSMIHVHGHDGYGEGSCNYEGEKPLKVCDLDNGLGKDIDKRQGNPLRFEGCYKVFYYGNNERYIAARTNIPETEESTSPKLASSLGVFSHACSISSASPNAEASSEDSVAPVSSRHSS